MFKGTLIDELISSVERAEQNAQKQQLDSPTDHLRREYPLRRREWNELIEVA